MAPIPWWFAQSKQGFLRSRLLVCFDWILRRCRSFCNLCYLQDCGRPAHPHRKSFLSWRTFWVWCVGTPKFRSAQLHSVLKQLSFRLRLEAWHPRFHLRQDSNSVLKQSHFHCRCVHEWASDWWNSWWADWIQLLFILHAALRCDCKCHLRLRLSQVSFLTLQWLVWQVLLVVSF